MYGQAQQDTKTLSQEVRRLKTDNEQLEQANKALEDSLKVLADKVEELTVNIDMNNLSLNTSSQTSTPHPSTTSSSSTGPSILTKLSDNFASRTATQQATLDQVRNFSNVNLLFNRHSVQNFQIYQRQKWFTNVSSVVTKSNFFQGTIVVEVFCT